MPEQKPQDPVVWSLFSGAMGLDLGLEQAGIAPSLAVEIDPQCCETIARNRPSARLLANDVRHVAGGELRHVAGFDGDLYLLAGGPPCQSFCPGGNRASLSDPRGNLIYEYFRLVGELRPRYFLFENVAHLITAALKHRPIKERPGQHWNLSIYTSRRTLGGDGAPPLTEEELSGSAVQALLQDIAGLGYGITFAVLDAADYGAPQHRLRFVMIGSREGRPPKLPRPTHGPAGSGLVPWVTLKDAISDLRFSPGPHSTYTEEVLRIFEFVPPGGNWRDLPPQLQKLALGGSFAAGGGKTGFFRRLAWDAPAPTVTGRPNRKGAALCHPEFTRPLSVTECARLQGFPEEWCFAGSMNKKYLQIGNAVPVQLGKALGRVLLDPYVELEDLDPNTLLEAAARRLRGAARNKTSTKQQLPLGLSC